ncbi:MAG: hypothetical protein ABJH68_01040 [Ilumatobacter sp.]|uniref:hypothetical protein n=1 Tax=Ilumatobacter sp. TaxID=1967498 RepID=UPI0032988152
MTTTDRSLTLAKKTLPLVAAAVLAIVNVGPHGGIYLVPFLVVALIGIVQAVRVSGLIGGFASSDRRLHGSVADTAPRGRALADELLDDG